VHRRPGRLQNVESILLIEDSRFLRKATERVLLKAGYRVVTAADGEEALRIAFATSPDLILLDMLLPKLSGPEVLRALRKNPCTQKTPIIVLSGLSQTNERKLKADGADAYFEKSSLNFDKDDGKSILQTVQRMLSKDPKKDADRLAHT
jgi:CheY-like chemotaxis protein